MPTRAWPRCASAPISWPAGQRRSERTFSIWNRIAQSSQASWPRAPAGSKNYLEAPPEFSLPPGYDPALFADVLPRQRIERVRLIAEDGAAEAKPPDADLARLDRMIAAEEEEFRTVRAGPVRALARLCEDWLRMRNATPSAPPFLVTIDPAYDNVGIEELRALLPRLAAEAKRIEAAPLPHKEAVAKLVAAIAEAVAQPGLSVQPFVDAAWQHGVLVGSNMPRPGSTGWWLAMAQVAPDMVRAHGARALDEYYAGLPKGAPIAVVDRAAMLDKIEERRRSIEFREEALIRAAGVAGEAERRSDVRAEFVLATAIEEITR